MLSSSRIPTSFALLFGPRPSGSRISVSAAQELERTGNIRVTNQQPPIDFQGRNQSPEEFLGALAGSGKQLILCILPMVDVEL